MEACNDYYYATRDPLGRDGDFTTAPEISQMFGELVGAALADSWTRAGRPDEAAYVELGCTVNDSAWGHLRGLRRSPDGFLNTTMEQRTNIPGLFAVGDCVNLLGQISVAAGQAAVAATIIHNDLLDW